MTPPTQISSRVAALVQKMRATRGRLIFTLDATMSRQPTWDVASSLQGRMFEATVVIGSLDVQLVYFRGSSECQASSWFPDAHELVKRMRTIRCESGATQIVRVLRHIRTEHERERVNAAIYVGDAIEENPQELYAAATGLPPIFWFQEGDGWVMPLDRYGMPVRDTAPPQKIETVFRELARLSNGAYARFDADAATRLGELLQAVAPFAVGGVNALADLRTDSARKLLGQMK